MAHIWAAGDITSQYQFSHVAAAQGKLVAHNVFARKPQAFDDRIIPWVTFTDPELARVGMTEADLQESRSSTAWGAWISKSSIAPSPPIKPAVAQNSWRVQMAKYSAGISWARMRAI